MCKLMATIGFQLDANIKNRSRMEAYFHRMERWSNLPALESRLRFMLKVCSAPVKGRVELLFSPGCWAGHGETGSLPDVSTTSLC